MVKRLFLTYDVTKAQESYFVSTSPSRGFHFIAFFPATDAKGRVYNVTYSSTGVELDTSMDYDVFKENFSFELKSNPRKVVKNVSFMSRNSKTTNRTEPNKYIAEDGSTWTVDNTQIRKLCLILP